MMIRRREFLYLTMNVATLLAGVEAATAQTYPSRLVRIIVGYAAGGSADLFARMVAQLLSNRLEQSFVVENRPGAGGNIATETVLRAQADGYSLLLITTPNLISAPLADDFDPSRDTAPVAGVAQAYEVLLIHPSVPAITLPEFIAYAKANPGKLAMASAGLGTGPHMSGELFKMMAGVDMIHVPYRGGGPALTDLLTGRVQVMFRNLPDIEYIKTGKLRALGVTSAVRLPSLPELPTVAEFVPGYEASVGFGICAPKGTAPEIVEKLDTAINASLADPAIKAEMDKLGAVTLPLHAAGFGKFLAEETSKWDKVARAANLKSQ